MRYAGEKKLNIWVAMALGILALFLLFVVYPLVLVLYKSVLSEDGNLSFAYFTKFFARKYYWSTLVNSLRSPLYPPWWLPFWGWPWPTCCGAYRSKEVNT